MHNVDSHVTHSANCGLNISQDESRLPLCKPPKTNIDDADDATAHAQRGFCIDAATEASPVSKLTTPTLLQPRGGLFNPPMMYSLP